MSSPPAVGGSTRHATHTEPAGALAEPEWAKKRLTGRDKKALTALAWAHINPYGTFHIDMSTHLDLGPASGLAEAA